MKNGSDTNGGGGRRGLPTIDDPVEGLKPLAELPGSSRTFLVDGDIKVPVRRIEVAGEPPVDIYDPAGPRGVDPHVGLPKLRQPWIDRRVRRAATPTSARCTTPAAASSPRRCASSPCAKG